MGSSDTKGSGRGSRWRRWRRVVLVLAATLLVLALTARSIINSSWFLRWQVEPVLADMFGGDVGFDRITSLGLGSFRIENLRVHVPDLDGPAGDLIEIARVDVTVDHTGLVHGKVEIAQVTLTDALVRISEQRANPGRYNFMALEPPTSVSALPRVRLVDAMIEVGIHEGARFELSGRRQFEGSIYPNSQGGSWYDLLLRESQVGEADGLSVIGQLNAETLEHRGRLEGRLRLDDVAGLLPQTFRLWWESMKLEGEISSAMLAWDGMTKVTAEIDIDDVALTLPVDASGWWSRYQSGEVIAAAGSPRLEFSRGHIRLDGKTLTLEDLTGTIGASGGADDAVEVPYDVVLEVGPWPSVDWGEPANWVEHVRRTVPFAFRATIDGFSVDESVGRDAPVELPIGVTRTLQEFGLTDWALDTEFEVRRGPPGADGDPAPTVARGSARIHKASARFLHFPYPLRDIEADIEFDTTEVRVLSLRGHGEDDATVELSGTIAPPTRDAAIGFDVTMRNLGLNDDFRDLVREQDRRIFSILFDRDRFASVLERAGSDGRVVGAAQSRLVDIAALVEAGGVVSETQKDARTRLQRSVDAGPFDLGAVVNADMRVERLAGASQPLVVEGTIDITSGTLVYEKFPYPVRFTEGRLHWSTGMVRIDQEVPVTFVTPSGGLGTMTGDFDITTVAGRTRVIPTLDVAVTDDAVAPLLIAAIPRKTDAPDAAAWIYGLGLSGRLDYTGTIGPEDDGKVGYDFAAELRGARLVPDDALATLLKSSGPLWPSGFAVDPVEIDLTVRRDAVVLDRIEGRHQDGPFEASGIIDLTAEHASTHLRLNVASLPVGDYMLNAAAADTRDDMAASWRTYEPRGVVDVGVWARGDRNEAPLIEIRPVEVTFALGDADQTVRWAGGVAAIDGGGVVLEELALGLESGGESDGVLTLAGGTGIVPGSGAAFELDWVDGRLEAPIVRTAGAAVGDWLSAMGATWPRGRFDARLEMVWPTEGSPRVTRTEIMPKTVAFESDGVPIAMRFDEHTMVTIEDGRVELAPVSGELDGAGRVQVVGNVRPGPPAIAELTFDYDGDLMAPPVRALLPDPVVRQFDAIDYRDGETARLEAGQLAIHPREEGGSIVDFQGVIETIAASMTAGTEFEDVSAGFDLTVRTVPGQPVEFVMDVTGDSARAFEFGLRDLDVHIEYDGAGHRMIVPDALASSCEGSIVLDGTFGLHAAAPYEMRLEVADVAVETLLDDFRRQAEAAETGFIATGRLFASVSSGGLKGRSESRYGRGAFRIGGGRLANLPQSFGLLRLFELASPVNSLGNATLDANFFVEGERLVFERCVLESSSLDLIGRGEIDYTDRELNMWFDSRSKVPVFRQLVSGVRGQLVTIRVSGPLASPRMRLVPGRGGEAARSARPLSNLDTALADDPDEP